MRVDNDQIFEKGLARRRVAERDWRRKRSLAHSHHHPPSNGIERISDETCKSRDGITECETGQRISFERSDEDDGFQGIVGPKVGTSVETDTDDGGGLWGYGGSRDLVWP